MTIFLFELIKSFQEFTLRQDFWNLTQSAPASAAAEIIFLASPTSPLIRYFKGQMTRGFTSCAIQKQGIQIYERDHSPGGFAPTRQ